MDERKGDIVKKKKFAIIVTKDDLEQHQQNGWDIDPDFLLNNWNIVKENKLYQLIESDACLVKTEAVSDEDKDTDETKE